MSEIKSINVLGIIAVVGALLMIAGVFMSWFQVSAFGETESISGWEVATDDEEGIFAYGYAPLIALVCGVISLIALILPVVLPARNISKVLGVIGLLLSVVTLVFSALYYIDVGSESLWGMTIGVGAGVWVVMAGAVITILGAILDIVQRQRSEPAVSEGPAPEPAAGSDAEPADCPEDPERPSD